MVVGITTWSGTHNESKPRASAFWAMASCAPNAPGPEARAPEVGIIMPNFIHPSWLRIGKRFLPIDPRSFPGNPPSLTLYSPQPTGGVKHGKWHTAADDASGSESLGLHPVPGRADGDPVDGRTRRGDYQSRTG